MSISAARLTPWSRDPIIALVPRLLLRTAMCELQDVSAFVECRLFSRPDLDPAEGARNARELAAYLTTEVLVPDGAFRGLLFDVREGPPVFGPTTRIALSEWFARGQAHGVRIAVVVGDVAIQRLQFSSLCREAAPDVSKVVERESEGWTWLGRAG